MRYVRVAGFRKNVLEKERGATRCSMESESAVSNPHIGHQKSTWLHAVNFRAVCGARVVTQHPSIVGRKHPQSGGLRVEGVGCGV